MHRFYADLSASDHECFILNKEDSYHAVRVLRLRSGDQAEAFFNGSRYLAELELSASGEVLLHPVRLLPSTEPALSITLFQGVPKREKMDFIVQKAVELGVSRIIPVMFSRCVIRMDKKDNQKKTERWRRIAREAGKQSGRCCIPEISYAVPSAALPGLVTSCEAVAVPWEECREGGPLAFVRRHPSISSLGIVIGPEGGIANEEIKEFLDAGCETVTLGKRILRTETAGLAALSVFFGLYGEME